MSSQKVKSKKESTKGEGQPSAFENLPADLRSKIISDLTFFIYAAHSSRGVVKFIDIKQCGIIDKDLCSRAALEDILKEVKRNFSDTFGIILREVDVGSTQILILNNKFACDKIEGQNNTQQNNEVDSDVEMEENNVIEQFLPQTNELSLHMKDSEAAKQSLLFIVLGYIFMEDPHNTTVLATHLEAHLEKLGIEITVNKAHPTFGNVKKFISCAHTADFVKQGWLSFREELGPHDQKIFFYSWGNRAHKIVSKRSVLEMTCEIVSSRGNRVKAENCIDHMQIIEAINKNKNRKDG